MSSVRLSVSRSSTRICHSSRLAHRDKGVHPRSNLRSLLSCEALEEDLGVTVDAKVLDRCSIWGVDGAIGSAGDAAKESASRATLSREGLHVGCVVTCVEQNKVRRKKRKANERKPDQERWISVGIDRFSKCRRS